MDNDPTINQPQELSERLLTASEVAYRLHISRCSAYNLMLRGTLATVRIGKSRRVRPQDLESFIQKNIFFIEY